MMLPPRETHPRGGGVLERTEFHRSKADVCALGAWKKEQEVKFSKNSAIDHLIFRTE